MTESDNIKIPLTIDEFAFLLFPGQLHGDVYVYDKERHMALKNRFGSLIGSLQADVIHKMGMAVSCAQSSKRELFLHPSRNRHAIEYAFELIESTSKDLFKDLIGYGYTSLVYSIGEDKVKKVPYVDFSNTELNLFSSIHQKSVAVFPKLFELNNRYVIMERLVTRHPKVERFRQYINQNVVHKFKGEIGYRELLSPIDALPEEFGRFINDISIQLKRILNVSSIGDLTASNIGMRLGTEEIVIFDPIDGLIAKELG